MKKSDIRKEIFEYLCKRLYEVQQLPESDKPFEKRHLIKLIRDSIAIWS